MRLKIFLILSIVAAFAFANVAIDEPCQVVNLDGKPVTIVLHGDEHFSYLTTVDGYPVLQKDGTGYVYARVKESSLEASDVLAHDADGRIASERAFLAGIERGGAEQLREAAVRQHNDRLKALTTTTSKPSFDLESFRGLVILVEFDDRQFSRPDARDFFDRVFNERGFPGFQCEDEASAEYGKFVEFNGSVRDYFFDNSHGVFEPHWDVVGPYNTGMSCLKGRSEYNSINNLAMKLADADIDFSQYDGNGDGKIDMVYFLYAGFPSNLGGNNSNYLWPCASLPGTSGNTYDGVARGNWACSTEFYSSEKSRYLVDFGSLCHEFSHCLGLLDLYHGNNGTYYWDLMSHGALNNRSRTPAGYSLQQRREVFDLEVPILCPETDTGVYSLNPLGESDEGFIIQSAYDGEIFLLENRQTRSGWDAKLPSHGMLLYRMNRSLTATNYELIRAGGVSTNFPTNPFPGSKRVTHIEGNGEDYPNLRTLDGKTNYFKICDITENDGIITFRLDTIKSGLRLLGNFIDDNETMLDEAQSLRDNGRLNSDGRIEYDNEANRLTLHNAILTIDDELSGTIIDYTGRKQNDTLWLEIEGDCSISANILPLALDDVTVMLTGNGSLTLTGDNDYALLLNYARLEQRGGVNIVAKGEKGGIGGNNSSIAWHDNEGYQPSSLSAYGTIGPSLEVTTLTLTDDYIISEPADAMFTDGVVRCGNDEVVGEWVKIETARLPLAIGGEQVYMNRDSTYWSYFTVRLKLLGLMTRGNIAYNHEQQTITMDNAWLKFPDNAIANGFYSNDLRCFLDGIDQLQIDVEGECVIECSEGAIPLSGCGGAIALTGNGTLRLISDTTAIDLKRGATIDFSSPVVEITSGSSTGAIDGDGSASVNINSGRLEIKATQAKPFNGMSSVSLGDEMHLTLPRGAYLDGAAVFNASGEPAGSGHYLFSSIVSKSGDINGDGKINVVDIVALVNYLLDEKNDNIVLINADVNDDGKVNILDIVALVNMTLE